MSEYDIQLDVGDFNDVDLTGPQAHELARAISDSLASITEVIENIVGERVKFTITVTPVAEPVITANPTEEIRRLKSVPRSRD